MKGTGEENLVLAAWKLPLVIATIAVAIVAGFYLGGPGLGMAVGAAVAASIIVAAVRAVPHGPIVPAALHDLRRHVLLVTRAPLEDAETVRQIATLCEGSDPLLEAAELRLLVPIRAGLLDRWSGERRPSRTVAERACVLSLASLTQVGLAARASIGDQDVLQAVEDELRVFPATDVILVTNPADRLADEEVATQLRARVRADFLQLEPDVDPRQGAAGAGHRGAAGAAADPRRRRP